jgi:hypothetical protein
LLADKPLKSHKTPKQNLWKSLEKFGKSLENPWKKLGKAWKNRAEIWKGSAARRPTSCGATVGRVRRVGAFT